MSSPPSRQPISLSQRLLISTGLLTQLRSTAQYSSPLPLPAPAADSTPLPLSFELQLTLSFMTLLPISGNKSNLLEEDFHECSPPQAPGYWCQSCLLPSHKRGNTCAAKATSLGPHLIPFCPETLWQPHPASSFSLSAEPFSLAYRQPCSRVCVSFQLPTHLFASLRQNSSEDLPM